MYDSIARIRHYVNYLWNLVCSVCTDGTNGTRLCSNRQIIEARSRTTGYKFAEIKYYFCMSYSTRSAILIKQNSLIDIISVENSRLSIMRLRYIQLTHLRSQKCIWWTLFSLGLTTYEYAIVWRESLTHNYVPFLCRAAEIIT